MNLNYAPNKRGFTKAHTRGMRSAKRPKKLCHLETPKSLRGLNEVQDIERFRMKRVKIAAYAKCYISITCKTCLWQCSRGEFYEPKTELKDL